MLKSGDFDGVRRALRPPKRHEEHLKSHEDLQKSHVNRAIWIYFHASNASTSPRHARMLLFSPSVGAIGLLKSPSRSGGTPFGAWSSCGDRCEQTLLARGALQELEAPRNRAKNWIFWRFHLVSQHPKMDFASISGGFGWGTLRNNGVFEGFRALSGGTC